MEDRLGRSFECFEGSYQDITNIEFVRVNYSSNKGVNEHLMEDGRQHVFYSGVGGVWGASFLGKPTEDISPEDRYKFVGYFHVHQRPDGLDDRRVYAPFRVDQRVHMAICYECEKGLEIEFFGE